MPNNTSISNFLYSFLFCSSDKICYMYELFPKAKSWTYTKFYRKNNEEIEIVSVKLRKRK